MNRDDAHNVLHVAELLHDASSPEALDRLAAERERSEAALEWFTEQGETEHALRLASALHVFWMERGHMRPPAR